MTTSSRTRLSLFFLIETGDDRLNGNEVWLPYYTMIPQNHEKSVTGEKSTQQTVLETKRGRKSVCLDTFLLKPTGK